MLVFSRLDRRQKMCVCSSISSLSLARPRIVFMATPQGEISKRNVEGPGKPVERQRLLHGWTCPGPKHTLREIRRTWRQEESPFFCRLSSSVVRLLFISSWLNPPGVTDSADNQTGKRTGELALIFRLLCLFCPSVYLLQRSVLINALRLDFISKHGFNHCWSAGPQKKPHASILNESTAVSFPVEQLAFFTELEKAMLTFRFGFASPGNTRNTLTRMLSIRCSSFLRQYQLWEPWKTLCEDAARLVRASGALVGGLKPDSLPLAVRCRQPSLFREVHPTAILTNF